MTILTSFQCNLQVSIVKMRERVQQLESEKSAGDFVILLAC